VLGGHALVDEELIRRERELLRIEEDRVAFPCGSRSMSSVLKLF
jgi:hypothetical protein